MPYFQMHLAFQMLALFTAVNDVLELPGALKLCSGLSQSHDNVLGCIKVGELQALNPSIATQRLRLVVLTPGFL